MVTAKAWKGNSGIPPPPPELLEIDEVGADVVDVGLEVEAVLLDVVKVVDVDDVVVEVVEVVEVVLDEDVELVVVVVVVVVPVLDHEKDAVEKTTGPYVPQVAFTT